MHRTMLFPYESQLLLFLTFVYLARASKLSEFNVGLYVSLGFADRFKKSNHWAVLFF